MKIESERMAGAASAAQSAELQRTERLDRYRQSESARPLPSDHVDISGLATTILKAGQANSAEHSARVQALAAAYQAGRYVVDPRQVSHKLIDASLAAGPAGK